MYHHHTKFTDAERVVILTNLAKAYVTTPLILSAVLMAHHLGETATKDKEFSGHALILGGGEVFLADVGVDEALFFVVHVFWLDNLRIDKLFYSLFFFNGRLRYLLVVCFVMKFFHVW